jgi:hypothetical protein
MSKRRPTGRAHLVIPSTGTRIPVPDGDDFDPEVIRAEQEALAAHPEVRARLERIRQRRAAGDPDAIPAEEVDRLLGRAADSGPNGHPKPAKPAARPTPRER